ncbi:MAG: class I SAM-dependent methyltransferase [Lysobacter sp.]|nr:MAG: class I SAM-dependent methyltransferase [Lysobacter sp.]
MSRNDHFSTVAATYAASRPDYPDALFDTLAGHVEATARVWEPGCGSGQATRGLASRFAHVHATDPSSRQLAQHWAASAPTPRVSLAVEPGERTGLANGSVRLVAVAQALHWFDLDAFFAECERVLVPGGVLAAWGYADFASPAGMETAVAAFRQDIDTDWPLGRSLVDGHYAAFRWPFEPLPAPTLWLEADWTLARLLGYLSSYSAVVRHRERTGNDAVAQHRASLTAAWGDPQGSRCLRWPLFLHLRRKA